MNEDLGNGCRAALCVKYILPREDERARARQGNRGSKETKQAIKWGDARSIAGARAGVSGKYVSDMGKVQRVAPIVFEGVVCGTINVPQAAALSGQSEVVQQRVLEAMQPAGLMTFRECVEAFFTKA